MAEDSNIIMAFIMFVLSFFGSCDGPDDLALPAPSPNRLEVIAAAPDVSISDNDVIVTLDVLEKRLENLDADIRWLGDNLFRLELPESSFTPALLRQGSLSFHLVKPEAETKSDLALDDLEAPAFDGIIRQATAYMDDYESPAVAFEIADEFTKAFADFTEAQIGKRLAIVLDNEILLAPVIHAKITGEGVIAGRTSLEEARDLALVLRSGALPFHLSAESVKEVSR